MRKISLLILTAILSISFSCKKENTQNKEIKDNKKNVNQILNRLKKPSAKNILVVAHRGYWRYAPENSLMAVQGCIDIEVDIVEIDVRLTKDNELVVIHDKTLDRTTSGSGKIEDFTLAEIKELYLKNACGISGSMQKVPTLEEVMLLAKDKILVNLDKTEGRTVRQAYEVLKKTGTIKQAIFKGNDSFEIMHNKYGSLLDSIIYMPKLWYKNENVKQHMKEYEETLNPFMYETLFDSEDAETFKLIPSIKSQGDTFLAISLWDELCAGYTDEKALINGPEESWGKLIELGANAIMTDRPKELIEYLKSKNLFE